MNSTEANNLLKRSNKIHFIGIGGIGVSAIARMALLNAKKVSGSDRDKSLIISELKKLGAKIRKDHPSSMLEANRLIKNVDLVIYTTAIPKSNTELKIAQKLKIPTITYPEALGLISKEKFTIAISGCHGKTTTTAMLGKILIDAKKDPTIIVGSLLKTTKSNLVTGKSNLLICEACEYKKAFLNLSPKIIIITNIDNDHLDYYKNLGNIQKAFIEFVSKLDKNDCLVCDKIDKNSLPVIKQTKCKIFDYSKIKLPKNFKLNIPGEHNIKNAKAALAVAQILKIPNKLALKSAEKFNGTWRRFEYKGKTKNNALIYDDYAHHPTEIKATLKMAKEFFKNKKIWCVFQPHLYSRTKLLMADFAKSFNNANKIILTDIYAAREQKDKKISAKMLADKIPNAIYIKSFREIGKFLQKNTTKNDIILTMGAGNIFKIGEKLLK